MIMGQPNVKLKSTAKVKKGSYYQVMSVLFRKLNKR